MVLGNSGVGHKLQLRFRFLDPSPSQMQASKEHLRHIWSCSDMLCSLGSWRPDIWHATWIWMTMFFTQKNYARDSEDEVKELEHYSLQEKLDNEVKELDNRLEHYNKLRKGFSKLQQTPLNILGSSKGCCEQYIYSLSISSTILKVLAKVMEMLIYLSTSNKFIWDMCGASLNFNFNFLNTEDLLVDSHQVLMVTVVAALRVTGNEIKINDFILWLLLLCVNLVQVYLLEVHDVWKNIGVPVIIGEANNDTKIINDWLNYDAILVNSFEAKEDEVDGT
ncbi:hypothetical protein L1987_41108 [Smallanthus sonchifolius]|uniref:Uncharacterized protein n=1 Tax=Smallanthus sonchifolius TaxID=185202 RepID=A0ACB9GTV6_9ASTR|nr:hypothetical protein L1987_41108 [Smallanthus sonchifolius]